MLIQNTETATFNNYIIAHSLDKSFVIRIFKMLS
jgi:hypothetical protein